MLNVPQGTGPKPLRIGHLSDLHLKSSGDLLRFESQLDRLVSQGVDHLAVTGDLLDAWNPHLLTRAIQALGHAGFDSPKRLTIIHGNHDLASVGGPRTGRDVMSQARRLLDLPTVAARRRHRFYGALAALHDGLGQRPPFVKHLGGGIELLTLDSVPLPKAPVRVTANRVIVTHAVGTIRNRDLDWLAALPPLPPDGSRILLLHHYPLDTPPLYWWGGLVEVPMAIEPGPRHRLWKAIRSANIGLVLCGHVHRARKEQVGGVQVGLQGTSGGAWAGYGSSVYDVTRGEALERRDETSPDVQRRAAAIV